MNVYLLSHSRIVEENIKSEVCIGIYSTLEIVQTTITKYKNIEGFKDYPDDFVIEEYLVISPGTKEILPGEFIYFLQHEYSIEEYDYVTNIDMFVNYDDAKGALEGLIKESKYQHNPQGLYSENGFVISNYILDEDNWTEGFVIY